MNASAIRRARCRRGVTLVEMSVMMTAVAAMLGICALMMGLAIRLQADGLSAFERSESLDRLAARFRADVHAARSAAIDGRTLRLEAETAKTVEYRVDDDGAVMRVAVDDGKDVARDPFRLPESVGARLELRDDGRQFAVIAVDLQPRKDRIDPVRTWEAVAVVGRNVPPQSREGGRP